MGSTLLKSLLLIVAITFPFGCARQRAAVVQVDPLLSTTTAPERVFIYSNAGQDEDQQSRDRYECYLWAVDQSGFDPSMPRSGQPPLVVVSTVPRQSPLGPPVLGAAGGAAAGAAIGAVAGDAGKGAAIGATAGAIAGVVQSIKDQEDREKQEVALHAQALSEQQRYLAHQSSNYRRALSACLEARGYTVR